MTKLFWGLFFTLLDFNVSFANEAVVVGLLPDFVGYFLLYFGAKEMKEHSESFRLMRPISLCMAVYASGMYLMDLISVNNRLADEAANGSRLSSVLLIALSILSVVGSILLTWLLVRGVFDLERETGWDIGGSSLERMWKILLVASLLIYVGYLIPAIGMLFIIASFIAGVCFLVSFYRVRRTYTAFVASPPIPYDDEEDEEDDEYYDRTAEDVGIEPDDDSGIEPDDDEETDDLELPGQ